MSLTNRMKKIDLHNIRNTGFKTPDNYFNSFEENLLTELKLKEQVSNTGMKAPSGYFENFKITVPVNKTTKSESKVISLFRNQKWLVAASVAAVFVLFIFLPKEQSNALDFASLENESIENYILTNDFESVELNNLITNTEAFENAIMEEALSDVSLEDYLYDNAELEDFN